MAEDATALEETETTTEAETTQEEVEKPNKDVLYDNTNVEKKEEKEEVTEKEEVEGEAKESTDKTDVKLEDEFELTIPEDSLLSDEQAEKTAKFIEEQEISQEVGQKILDDQSEAVQVYAAAQNSIRAERIDGWKQTSLNDKIIGGENHEKIVKGASHIMNQLCDQDFIEFITNPEEGLSFHPGFIKLFHRLKTMSGEAGFALAGGTIQEKRSTAEVLFDNTKEL